MKQLKLSLNSRPKTAQHAIVTTIDLPKYIICEIIDDPSVARSHVSFPFLYIFFKQRHSVRELKESFEELPVYLGFLSENDELLLMKTHGFDPFEFVGNELINFDQNKKTEFSAEKIPAKTSIQKFPPL